MAIRLVSELVQGYGYGQGLRVRMALLGPRVSS